jgi:hypothetical protein
MKLEHYLASVPIRGGYYYHGYIMAPDRNTAHLVAMRMMDQGEKLGMVFWPAIILETHLSTGVKLVRRIICKMDNAADAVEGWKTAKKVHLTAWAMREDDPDSRRLMALH